MGADQQIFNIPDEVTNRRYFQRFDLLCGTTYKRYIYSDLDQYPNLATDDEPRSARQKLVTYL